MSGREAVSKSALVKRLVRSAALASAGMLAMPSVSAVELTSEFIRAFSGTGVDRLQLVFTLDGSDRGLYAVFSQGPSLSSDVVVNFLRDPRIQLIDNATGATVDSNDNWQDHPSAPLVGTVAEALGVTLDPLDAAMVVDLSSGLYTLVVTGTDGGTGTTRAGVLSAGEAVEVPTLTPGTWRTADGSSDVCFNVSADGTRLTSEGSLCDGGNSIDMDVDTFVDGVSCDAEVETSADVPIVNNGFVFDSGDQKASGVFTSAISASGLAVEQESSGVCTASWEASPAQ